MIPPSTQVTIGSDGTVSVVPQGSAPFAVTQVDRIKLVNPKTTDLQKGDDGLLRLKSGGKAKTDDTVSVTSGMLESSNVNAAQSLISMIELQRLYEFQIKSINSTDTNEQSAERTDVDLVTPQGIHPMNLALWAAKTGLDAQNTRMAIIANNLANTNTTGFKAGRAAFQDLMYQNIRQVGAQSTQNTQYSTGLTLGTGVRIVATEKDYTQGSVMQTNGALDLSVNGRGFFQITMPDGTIAYTRDGTFSLDNQGNVVTASGLSAAAGDQHSRGHAVGHHRHRRRGDGHLGDQHQGHSDRPDSAGRFHQRGRPAAHRQQLAGGIRGQRLAAGGHGGHQWLGHDCSKARSKPRT